MKKYSDEFFDIFEKSWQGALLFMLAMALISVSAHYMGPDVAVISGIKTKEAFLEFLSNNYMRISLNSLVYLCLSAFSGMGYWGCIMSEGKTGAGDFFKNGSSMFLKSLPGYLVESLIPFIIISVALFSVIFSAMFLKGAFLGSFLSIMVLGLAVWFCFRIILWEPFLFAEKIPALSAIRKSFEFTRGRFLLIFTVVMLPALVFNVVGDGVHISFLKYSFLAVNTTLIPLYSLIITKVIFRIILSEEKAVNAAPEKSPE